MQMPSFDFLLRTSRLPDLFRREAVDHATRRLLGEVLLTSPLSTMLLSAALCGLVFLAVVFASLATYARKETVQGWLVPPSGVIRVEARQGGVVESLLVREGQTVIAGQPLATVRLSEAMGTENSFAPVERSLRELISAAEVRAEAARVTLAQEQRTLAERELVISNQLNQSRRQLALQAERIEIAKAEVDRATSIAARGFLPTSQLDARRTALLSLRQDEAELTAVVLGQERDIADLRARAKAIPNELASANAEAASIRGGLVQQRAQAEVAAVYTVVSSVSGVIAALPVRNGQSLSSGASVAIVSTGNDQLEAELYLPSRASGFIRPGQDVRVMYEAFPYQKFGSGHAEILSVSQASFTPTETGMPGLAGTEAVYRARARMISGPISAYGQSIPLRPGMLLNADIVIERRSLIEWLLDPLYAAGRRA